ncbi:MAG: hypothetical protein AB1861_05530 [Cyanobacteriota bacterium]
MYSNLASDRSKRYRFATTSLGVHYLSLNTEYKRSPQPLVYGTSNGLVGKVIGSGSGFPYS